MKALGPIIMQHFSASRPVFVVELSEDQKQNPDQYGVAAVHNASWLETRGDSVTWISERWTLVAHNIWRAT